MTTTSQETLSSRDFERLRGLIYSESGINLGLEKKTMVEIRLRRRLKELDVPSCKQYCDYLFGPHGGQNELIHLIDVVTTNKTDFFREPHHFEYLVSNALPDLMARKGIGRRLLIWSAGCSTGEEPFTLSIVLSEYALTCANFHFAILGTDICTEVLAKATAGIFKSEAVRPIPAELRRKYLMRSRDPNSDLFRVVPELRNLVQFRRLNFMDVDFGLSEPQDVVFCRNVIIYFDRPTQVRILEKLVRNLTPGGYFFAGHSESLQNMDLPLVPVAPSIFRKRA